MESAAFKKLTEQIAEVAELVGFIASNAIENTQRRKMEPVLTNDDVTKMLGISKQPCSVCAPATVSSTLWCVGNADTTSILYRNCLRNEQ